MSAPLLFAVVLLLPVLICSVRAYLGPSAPDRVVAIDALTSVVVGILSLLAVHYRSSILLDVALVYALLAFVGTLAVSKYLESRRLEG